MICLIELPATIAMAILYESDLFIIINLWIAELWRDCDQSEFYSYLRNITDMSQILNSITLSLFSFNRSKSGLQVHELLYCSYQSIIWFFHIHVVPHFKSYPPLNKIIEYNLNILKLLLSSRWGGNMHKICHIKPNRCRTMYDMKKQLHFKCARLIIHKQSCQSTTPISIITLITLQQNILFTHFTIPMPWIVLSRMEYAYFVQL